MFYEFLIKRLRDTAGNTLFTSNSVTTVPILNATCKSAIWELRDLAMPSVIAHRYNKVGRRVVQLTCTVLIKFFFRNFSLPGPCVSLGVTGITNKSLNGLFCL